LFLTLSKHSLLYISIVIGLHLVNLVLEFLYANPSRSILTNELFGWSLSIISIMGNRILFNLHETNLEELGAADTTLMNSGLFMEFYVPPSIPEHDLEV